MKPLSILLVDDDPSITTVLCLLLGKESHRVTVAYGADEAKLRLQRETFDVVITDMLLNVGDGIEVIQLTKTNQPAARIVAMSGGGRFLRPTSSLRIASSLGAHATLSKPFSRDELLLAVYGDASVPAGV